MDKAKTTPKDFFLWAGAMVALYWSVVAFIFLIFEYINYALPNPLSYYPSDPYQGSIPYEMASIIVLFPLYLFLAWTIRRDIIQDASRADIWVRRWAIIFTLFVAGVTIAIDLITVLTSFLRGDEITLAFLMKVLVVLLVAAGIFMHFIADLWGYWMKYPMRRRSVFIGVLILAFGTVILGFFIVGAPWTTRLYRFDDQKVSDLTTIQYQVVSYYQAKQALPTNLSDLNDSISGFMAPLDPQNGQAYIYQATGALSFQLCATFNRQSRFGYTRGLTTPSGPTPASVGLKNSDNWQHGVGNVCFDRVIDPQLYQPTSSPVKGL